MADQNLQFPGPDDKGAHVDVDCSCLLCRLTALHREITRIILAVSPHDQAFADSMSGLALDLSELILRAPRLQLPAASVAPGYDTSADHRIRAKLSGGES